MARLFVLITILCLMFNNNCLTLRLSITELQRDFDAFQVTLSKNVDGVKSKKTQPVKSAQISTIEETYSNCNVVRIYCRTDLLLAVIDGNVSGVQYNPADKNLLNKNGFFQIETYGNSIIRIKDVQSQQYLKMSNKGKIELTKDKTDESFFFQHQEETGYTTFASAKYYVYEKYDLFIGVKRNGRIRSARNTMPGQKSSQFLHVTQGDKQCRK